MKLTKAQRGLLLLWRHYAGSDLGQKVKAELMQSGITWDFLCATLKDGAR